MEVKWKLTGREQTPPKGVKGGSNQKDE